MIPPQCLILPAVDIKLEQRILGVFFPCSTTGVLLPCMYGQSCCRALSCGGGLIQGGGTLLWRDMWQETMLNEPLMLQYVTCSVFLSVPHPAHLHVQVVCCRRGIVLTSGASLSTYTGILCQGVPCLEMVMAVCCSWEMHHQLRAPSQEPWLVCSLFDRPEFGSS